MNHAVQISLKGAGKRFNRDWIFRHWDMDFNNGHAYAIMGGNGSGKSTALRSLLGYAPLSEGTVRYIIDGSDLSASNAYKYMSFCSPYLELYEELTVREMARFHFSLKSAKSGVESRDLGDLIQLSKAADRPVKHLSSGMKQRLRLGLALYSDTSVVFLDEPTSNLDRTGIKWYKETVEATKGQRLFIVASNQQEEEYFFCGQKINIEKFKPS